MDKKIKVINRNTKSASPSSEKSSSNNIIKNFMRGLMTTEELIKKNKDKGLVKIRLDVSSNELSKLKRENLINREFDSIIKNVLKNKNKKIFNFVSKRAINFGKK